MKKYLIVIAGPTAVGKTKTGINLAQEYNTEIISADSRQFYKELNIGVAKPTANELNIVKHHFINYISVKEHYNAGMFESDTINCLKKLFNKHDVVIMVGGSGLYIKAVCEGIDDVPKSNSEIRDNLNKEYKKMGVSYLQEELKTIDPKGYEKIDIQNPHRLIRALEVAKSTGSSFTSFHTEQKKPRDFNIIKIGLNIEREDLYDNINNRVDEMLNTGLVEEVENLKNLKNCNALQTVGYEELFEYLEGNIDLETAIALIKRNSRRYAKRQLTWFRKDKEIYWFKPSDIKEIKRYISDEIDHLEEDSGTLQET